MFLRNFYDKSRRSIEKPLASGPAAYVFPADEKRNGSQARLLRILQLQHVDVSRLASATTVNEPERTNEAGKKPAALAGRRSFPPASSVVRTDRNSGWYGTRVVVRFVLGGRRFIKTNKEN